MAVEPSPDFGALQAIVSELFNNKAADDTVRRLEVVVLAESYDLPADLQEIVRLLPPGEYTRPRLCDQLNSALGGHGWGLVYGTVE